LTATRRASVRARRLRGLTAAGAAVLMIVGVATLSSQPAQELYVCHAGSLQSAFNTVEKAFTARYPHVVVKDVSGGSVALAARMAAGTQACDVFAAADHLDVDLLLKPAALADYTIVFAKGRMVLAYLATDPETRGIAAAGEFNPPARVPTAAPDWYRVLLAPGVRIAGSHPFLDPAGYRSHMMFQLAQAFYGVPNLSSQLLEHYTILPDVGGAGASTRTLGTDFTFQFTYEHSAAAAARSNPAYRYVTLPDQIDLSTAINNGGYARAAVTIPAIGFPGITSPVAIPASRVAWGLTIPAKTQNREHAIVFVSLLLGTPGTTALTSAGPAPITPAHVNRADYTRLPAALQSLVRAGDGVP
jgi:molybdate/tungstate transport system substrate-binding protein